MPAWVATLVVAGITLVGNALITAYFFGSLAQRVKNVEQIVEKHDVDERQQWEHIGELRENVAKVKGKLGINGA